MKQEFSDDPFEPHSNDAPLRTGLSGPFVASNVVSGQRMNSYDSSGDLPFSMADSSACMAVFRAAMVLKPMTDASELHVD